MRGVGHREVFICRDCGEHAFGIVLKVTAAGVGGIGHVEVPQGWTCAATVGGMSFVCRRCSGRALDALERGGGQ